MQQKVEKPRQKPCISVVVPAYNEEKLIAQCVESLLRQNFLHPYEIIIVNNASTDKTAEVLKNFPQVRSILEKKRGVGNARQRGFTEAKADIIASTDADCMVPTDWLSKIWEFFSKDEELICVGGYAFYYDAEIFNAFQKISHKVGPFSKLKDIIGKQPLSTQNLAVKKWAWKKAGGFNTKIQSPLGLDDLDMTLRLNNVGKVVASKHLKVHASARRYKKKPLKTTVYRLANFASYSLRKKGIDGNPQDEVR